MEKSLMCSSEMLVQVDITQAKKMGARLVQLLIGTPEKSWCRQPSKTVATISGRVNNCQLGQQRILELEAE